MNDPRSRIIQGLVRGLIDSSIKPLFLTEGARSRSATPPGPAGPGFRVPPAKRAGALLVGAKTKRPVAFATGLSCFGAHGGSSVTFRDPAWPCRARLSIPSRKARRRFARGRQNAKGRLLSQPAFLVLVPTEGARSRSATPPGPAGPGFRVPPAKRAGALLVGAKTQKAGCFRNRPFLFWCPRRDSNPHTLRHMDLNHARLPIPPRGLR